MATIFNFRDKGSAYHSPPAWPGLEKVICFPDGEYKNERKSERIPNGTVWVFDSNGHQFRPEIHGNDIGCGMAAYLIDDVDAKEGADAFYEYLKGKNLLGRGNHFVDLCAPISSVADITDRPYKILFIHTHGPEKGIPGNLKEAGEKQEAASQYRLGLGQELAKLVSSRCELIGDWAHNSVEETKGKVIYRKGAVKVKEDKLHFLPAHLGIKIMLYTVSGRSAPPYSSMPHATGRVGPRGETKVTPEKAAEIRDLVYIPAGISNDSLRSEHPSCYKSFSQIFEFMQGHFFAVGETRILSYVGKV